MSLLPYCLEVVVDEVMHMLEHYLRWHQYTLETLSTNVANVIDVHSVEMVVVTGMGGSGIVGDVLASIASDYSNIPIYVYKDFYVPKNLLTTKTFVLAISYSGNTLETVSAAIASLNRGSKLGVVTSGGRLLELAKSRGVPYITIRGGLVPRLAMPMMLAAAVKLLTECQLNLVPLTELQRSIDVLGETSKAMGLANNIAELLKTTYIPTIVASTRYQALAYRFKNELNENSKIPVKVEILPELFHNDIVGWEDSKLRDCAILINSDLEYENKLIEFYADYLGSVGLKTYKLALTGNIIERYLFGSLVAGITSVLIAKHKGLDPIQTKSITLYKNTVKDLENEVLHSRQ